MKIIKYFNYLMAVFLVFAAIFLAYIAVPFFGNKALIVKSGSMSPKIKSGDLVVVNFQNDINSPQSLPIPMYKEGEIIAFKDAKNANTIVTHRVVGSEVKTGKVYYQTKGDANNTQDINLTSQENVLGKSTIIIPSLGKVFAAAKSKNGFLLLIIFPAFAVIFSEILNLYREFTRVIKARRFLQTYPKEKIENQKLIGPLGIRVLLPFVIGTMFSHNSFAYFTDSASSINNTFTAASVFPAPTPSPTTGHVVINEVYFDPNASHMQGANADENNFEWVEIFNPTSSTINLKDWKIVENTGIEKSISESNRNLGSGEFAVLAKASDVRIIWGVDNSKFIAIGQNFGNGLANTGDRVILKDNLGNIIDQMSYGTDTTILNPSATDVVEGDSLERNPTGTDTDTAADFANRNPPTPGS